MGISNRGARQALRESLHRRFVTVHEERARRPRLRVPGEQLGLVCVRREAVDRVHASAHRDLLAEDGHAARAVDDAPRQRACAAKPTNTTLQCSRARLCLRW